MTHTEPLVSFISAETRGGECARRIDQVGGGILSHVVGEILESGIGKEDWRVRDRWDTKAPSEYRNKGSNHISFALHAPRGPTTSNSFNLY